VGIFGLELTLSAKLMATRFVLSWTQYCCCCCCHCFLQNTTPNERICK